MQQVDSKVDSKATRKARLTQYRKHDGRWQFFAVARTQKDEPAPKRVIVAGKQVDWKRPGAKCYLDWMDSETGKRIREIAGRGTREAKEAWIRKSRVLVGDIEADEPASFSPTMEPSMTPSRGFSSRRRPPKERQD